MEWLPGSSVFRDHTPAFWLNLFIGGGLGFVAGRVRSIGTRFEGSTLVAVLSTAAGVVLGVTIFAFFGLVVLLMNLQSGQTAPTEVIVLSLCGQVVAFAAFAWRRR